ncbi:hypothetical protein BLS_006195 [Venturia inaequalis]|uniref:Uncharacterized protein n=1 Tax=Venturia inaequalis TaxID=5025 RepID=A0A8H3V3C9_VENIN|nr:hypothetical protein BLS_006195 [Venturia inaequalis]KAE9986035.1 hypothetical protein EG328_006586 [Venturia inaequalis]
MRSRSPEPAKTSTSTTPNFKKRNFDDIEPEVKSSKPTKHCRITRSHQQDVGSPSRLEALPSELQHEIYKNLFQGIEEKVEEEPIRVARPWPLNPPVKLKDKPTSKLSNVTAILRASKKTNLEAVQAFNDTVARPINLWRSDLRRVISPSDQRVTRAQFTANDELQATLKHRHIIINVQLEFEEDRTCLQNFRQLLNLSRQHTVTLNLNLGFIDSHGPFHENGLVFKKEDEEMKDLVSELLSWKAPRSTLKMRYTTGCICGGNGRFPSIKQALEHLGEETKAKEIPLMRLEDFPRDWPRWEVQGHRNGRWDWPRRRVVRRMSIDSV